MSVKCSKNLSQRDSPGLLDGGNCNSASKTLWQHEMRLDIPRFIDMRKCTSRNSNPFSFRLSERTVVSRSRMKSNISVVTESGTLALEI